MRSMSILFFLGFVLLLTFSCKKTYENSYGINPSEPAYYMNSSISYTSLTSYLDRAVTFAELCTPPEYYIDGKGITLDDDLRMIQESGAKLIGRALFRWGGEDTLMNPDFFSYGTGVMERAWKFDSDIIFQAAIFEIVTSKVDEIPIPEHVFIAYDLEPEQRNFIYKDMLYSSGKFVNHWGDRASVPDITQQETQLWMYYLATEYISAGFEAIHWGQVDLMGKRDRKLYHWNNLLSRIRLYAKEHARRGYVLYDAHAPTGGFRFEDNLLMDFHSFPLRIVDVPSEPLGGELRVGYKDAIYTKSMGGITASGWSCEQLPYLVEFDNFGISTKPGKPNPRDIFIWGYDEITWFSKLPPVEQSAWLRYASHWIQENDSNGFLQMPMARVVTPEIGGRYKYKANNPTESYPKGSGLELTIQELWGESEK